MMAGTYSLVRNVIEATVACPSVVGKKKAHRLTGGLMPARDCFIKKVFCLRAKPELGQSYTPSIICQELLFWRLWYKEKPPK